MGRSVRIGPITVDVLRFMHRCMHMTEEELNHPPEDLHLPFLDLALEDMASPDVELGEPTLAAYPPKHNVNRNSCSEKISIRIANDVLDRLKKKASYMGLPYQTYINQILATSVAHASEGC